MVFVVMTFYMDDAYFNLLGSKAYIFLMMAFLYAIGILLCEREKPVSLDTKKKEKQHSIMDIAVIVFAAVSVLSNLFSQYKTDAFWGSYGWNVGTLYILALTGIYFMVSRYMKWKNWMYGVVTGSATVVFLWAITDEFYLDIFGMHQDIATETAYNYLASIGNNNWFSGYWALILPFFVFGLKKGPIWKNILVGAGLFIAVFAGVNCRADSLYLGFGVILVISLLRALGDREKSIYTGLGWMIIGLAIGASKFIRNHIRMIEIDEISLKVMNSQIWMIIFVVGVIMMLLPDLKWKKYIRGGLLVVGIFAVIVGICSQAQQFGPTWGTFRGETWLVAIEAFGNGTFLEKLIGIGPDCFGHIYREMTGSDWFRNAHNEYLQYLVTMGVMGLLSYIGIFAGTFAEMHKMTGEDTQELPLQTICFTGIMAYAAQAVVNNPQALNGAILFTLLAILRGVHYTKRKEVI